MIQRAFAVTLAAAGLAIGFTPTARAQDGGATLPRWAPSIEAGLAQAKERGVALMVALNMDNERGNQSMLDEVYTSPEFNAAAKKCVVAVGSLFVHHERADAARGVKVCERFGSITCKEHQEIEKTVRTEWLQRGPKDDIECPRHFFVAPSGKILFERVWTMKKEDLAALMVRASELCTPERLANWDTLEGRLQRAGDSMAAVRDIALGELIGLNDPDVDAKLMELAKTTKDPNVAGSVLGAFARADTPERRKLSHEALGSKQAEVRMFAAYAMQKSGFAEHLAPLLARVVKEKDDKARGAMYRAIGVLAVQVKDEKEGKTAYKVLLKGAADSKDDARGHAAIGVATWATEKAVQTALEKMLVAGGPVHERSAATWALGYSESDAVKDVLKEQRASLGKWDWRVRNITDAAIAKLEGKESSMYGAAPDYFLPNPVDGDPPKNDDWPGKK